MFIAEKTSWNFCRTISFICFIPTILWVIGGIICCLTYVMFEMVDEVKQYLRVRDKQIHIWNIVCIVFGFLILIGGFSFVYYNFLREDSVKEYWNQEFVYISQGQYAKRFHTKKSCKGLRNSKKVLKVSLIDAESKYNRTPCRYCCEIMKTSQDLLYENFGD